MIVVKQGYAHKIDSMNCQDAAGINDKYGIKIICDGCSEGKFSEVGAQTFVRVFMNTMENIYNNDKTFLTFRTPMYMVMDKIVDLFGNNVDTLKNYLSFTTLAVYGGNAYICGDGYLIIQKDDDIIFKKFEFDDFPPYLVYNYIPANRLSKYQNGVSIEKFNPSDHDYDQCKIGVASDGIRFVVDRSDDDPIKKEFIEILKSGKDIKMKLFINRNEKIFKDDVSIAF